MPEIWIVILLHQLIFQRMFATKNIILHRKIGKQIRGNNIEATISIAFFAFFIGIAVVISFLQQPIGKIQLLNAFEAMALGLGLLILNLIVSGASLINLKILGELALSRIRKQNWLPLVYTGFHAIRTFYHIP